MEHSQPERKMHRVTKLYSDFILTSNEELVCPAQENGPFLSNVDTGWRERDTNL